MGNIKDSTESIKHEAVKHIEYLLALHSVNGLGPIRLKRLLDVFKDPKLAWEASAKEILNLGIPQNVANLLVDTRKKLDPQNYLESVEKSGIKFLTVFDEDYPPLLKQIYDPPTVIYYKGEILPGDGRAIAVVGTRKMTGYGKLVTERFASDLVGLGVTIVSGLARGADSEAHKAAIVANGRTLAVLGGGLQNIYPPENTDLARKISEGFGAVISESPFDRPYSRGVFPSRNRVISGLSLGVLVTEATESSGSLITARCALDQGRDVFAIPGPITSEFSKGPAYLIKQGAKLVTCAEEVLEELGMEGIKNEEFSPHQDGVRVKNYVHLTESEQRILESLVNEEKHIDEVCRELGLAASEVSASLVKMEITGFVKNLGGGNYIKIC